MYRKDNMGRLGLTLIFGFILLTAGACTKKVKTAEQVIGGPQDRATAPEQAFPQAADEIREGDLETTRVVMGLNDIFFDFDRSLIRPDARRVLEENARWLKQNGNRRIVIEGHADERGTNEYNLALADRRALATKRYLVSLGVDPDQIRTISYGEERPFCTQHNEQCWQQNRRGHFVMAD